MYATVKELCARLKKAGHSCTLLGIGPVSVNIVRAAFEACKAHDCPPIFIASRNQVDLKSLGHGYLMGGMDARTFVALLKRTARSVGYRGPLYIGRDHGGPWQRDVELREKYPVEQAMAIARQSFAADLAAGFNYLHIDPTKCPHPFTPADLCRWTVDLVAFCEATRKRLGQPPVDYEVGTEDIQGGLTTEAAFGQFLKTLQGQLAEKGLPSPTCVVGQTGTLTRLDRNVGHFNRDATRRLAAAAARQDVGFKEHNGDYLSAATCRIHPGLGVTGMNVAPEFGLVETDALLALADLEAKLVREGWLKNASRFREILTALTFTDSPWKKWMTDDLKRLPEGQIESDSALRLLIARVCGHYVYNRPEIVKARATLTANINRHRLVEDAGRFVAERVLDSIVFYLLHFNMRGINRYASSAARTPPRKKRAPARRNR